MTLFELPDPPPPTSIPVLSLWQPWATLVALGVKTIETRSWSTHYRGPLAIHAAARRPRIADLGDSFLARHGWIGAYQLGKWCDEVEHVYDDDDSCDCDDDENVLGRCARASDLRPALLNDEGGHGWSLAAYLPLGAIVAVVELVDVLPMVLAHESEECVVVGDGDGVDVWTPPDDPQPEGHEPSLGGLIRDVNDQAPYGDFRPGRFAWMLEDVRSIEPRPFAGGQGLSRKVELEELR